MRDGGLQLNLKGDFDTDVFLSILWNFSGQRFAEQLWTTASWQWDVLRKINVLENKNSTNKLLQVWAKSTSDVASIYNNEDIKK